MAYGEPSNTQQNRLETLEGGSAQLHRTLETLPDTLAGIMTQLGRLERRVEERERERENKRSNDKEPWSHASWRGHGREEMDLERLRRKERKVEARKKKVERWLEEEGPSTSRRGRWPEEDPTYVQRLMGQRNFMDGPRSPKNDAPKFGGSSHSWWDEVKQDLEACKMIIESHKASKPLPPKEPSKEEEETSSSSKEEEEKNEERPLHVEGPSSEEPQFEVKEEPSLEGSIEGSPDHQCTTGRASFLDEGSEEEEVTSGTTEAPSPPSYMTLEDKGRFQGWGTDEDPTPGPLIPTIASEPNHGRIVDHHKCRQSRGASHH